ncbi:MAG: XisI protein [Leptolyngbyaceae cyanobacterium MO_188.B28]|nr:XisI protein [Leptolyngbyaceae cyanobacterium MO_188.B28]
MSDSQLWQESGIENQVIFDSEYDHYLLLKAGWEGDQRIYYPVFHFDIKDGKIWIQENTTDVEIDKNLEEVGISKKEIVVGFHHPSMRESSDFAVA